jgi:hypothetical protein
MIALGLQDWLLWAWVAVVAAGLVAAVVARVVHPGTRPTLPLRHVAAATLIAILGWQALLMLPSTVLQFASLSPEIGGPTGQLANRAWVAAALVHVVAAVIAVVAILRRTAWGTVLGIGVAVANLGINAIGTISMLGFVTEFPRTDITFQVYAATNALSAVPALVAIVLLLAPLLRARAGRSDRGDRGDTASEGEDGITDVDSQAARDVDRPEWDAPAERRT